MEQALAHLFAKNGKCDIGLPAFLEVVGPIYLEFAALSNEVLLTEQEQAPYCCEIEEEG